MLMDYPTHGEKSFLGSNVYVKYRISPHHLSKPSIRKKEGVRCEKKIPQFILASINYTLPPTNISLSIFGREDLVPKGAIPDFSDIPVHKLISFFREANFETLTMKPYSAQYLPTNTSNEESNKSLRDQKKHADTKGSEWTSKYLFHIPLKKGKRRKEPLNLNDINGVEEDGGGIEDIILNQIPVAEQDSVDRMVDSQSNQR